MCVVSLMVPMLSSHGHIRSSVMSSAWKCIDFSTELIVEDICFILLPFNARHLYINRSLRLWLNNIMLLFLFLWHILHQLYADLLDDLMMMMMIINRLLNLLIKWCYIVIETLY
jgi:hypothetical protein